MVLPVITWCQGDTEKYLARENLYHPMHTCITRDVVESNTGVVIQMETIPETCTDTRPIRFERAWKTIREILTETRPIRFENSGPRFDNIIYTRFPKF